MYTQIFKFVSQHFKLILGQGSKFTGATALIAPSYTSIAPSDGKIADTQGPKMTPRSWEQSKVKSTVK